MIINMQKTKEIVGRHVLRASILTVLNNQLRRGTRRFFPSDRAGHPLRMDGQAELARKAGIPRRDGILRTVTRLSTNPAWR